MEFLNIDLDLSLDIGLKTLLEDLGDDVIILNQTDRCASVELAKTQPRSPDEAIKQYHTLFRSLLGSTAQLWSRCTLRSFNIGLQCSATPQKQFALSARSIALLEEMETGIVITLYPPKETSQS